MLRGWTWYWLGPEVNGLDYEEEERGAAVSRRTICIVQV